MHDPLHSAGLVNWKDSPIGGVVVLDDLGQCATSFQVVIAAGQSPEGAVFTASFAGQAPCRAIGVQTKSARTSDIGLLQLLDCATMPAPPSFLATRKLSPGIAVQIPHHTQIVTGRLTQIDQRAGADWLRIDIDNGLPPDLQGYPVWLGQQGIIGVISALSRTGQTLFALSAEGLAALHGGLQVHMPEEPFAGDSQSSHQTTSYYSVNQGNIFTGSVVTGAIIQSFGVGEHPTPAFQPKPDPEARLRANIFISYRRKPSSSFAQLLCRAIEERIDGRVFLDMNTMRAGPFDEQLLRNIRKCDIFLLIVSEGTFDRINEPGDWLHREIIEALALKRQIIPVFHNGTLFPANLPDDIAAITIQQGLIIADNYTFDAGINKLIEYIQTA